MAPRGPAGKGWPWRVGRSFWLAAGLLLLGLAWAGAGNLILAVAPGSRPSQAAAWATAGPGPVAVRWPWGPRVQVGTRSFRIDVRPDPGRAVQLEVWELAEPAADAAWREALEQAIHSVRRRYPRLGVELSLLSRQEMDRRMAAAKAEGRWPDLVATVQGAVRLDAAWQVPLEGYLAHAMPSGLQGRLLPGAVELATLEGHVWGLPRWVEWMGWAVRPQGGAGRLAIELSNPLTWRMLAGAAVPPGGQASGPAQAGSVWARVRLEQAARWLESVAPRLVDPARVCVLGPTELLLRGEAVAAGPVSGRMALRLGAWPRPGLKGVQAPGAPGAQLALAGRVAVEGVGAQLPGPLLLTSTYAVFAREGADDARLRLAWELALAMAQAASQVLAEREGVVPAWDPRGQEAAAGERAGAGSSGPNRVAGAGWWESYPLAPGVAEVVRQAAARTPGGGAEPSAGGAGGMAASSATTWEDLMHERTVVELWALEFCRGDVGVKEFVERVSR